MKTKIIIGILICIVFISGCGNVGTCNENDICETGETIRSCAEDCNLFNVLRFGVEEGNVSWNQSLNTTNNITFEECEIIEKEYQYCVPKEFILEEYCITDLTNYTSWVEERTKEISGCLERTTLGRIDRDSLWMCVIPCEILHNQCEDGYENYWEWINVTQEVCK